MKTMKILMVVSAMIIAGAIFYSCQKENTTQPVVKEQGVKMLKTAYAYEDCETQCIEPGSGDYFYKTAQVTVQWGGPNQDANTKVVDLKYYNTETHFVIEFKSTHSPQNLYIDDVLVLTSPQNSEGTWFSYPILLEEGWEACDLVDYDVYIDGSGPVADFGIIEYEFIGICQNCEWVWEDETAWADGVRYNEEQGNWATYTIYAEGTVILYAGQTMEAGTVQFSAVVDGNVTITITLNNIINGIDWRFTDVEKNVKIQDYELAPSGNPSPGLFDYYGYATDKTFSIVVPANNYYGVHVDVEWGECVIPE